MQPLRKELPESVTCSLVFVTQQFQLLFTFVLGDFFTPFLFQVAHFQASSVIFFTLRQCVLFKISLFYGKSNPGSEKKSDIF